MVKSSLQWDLDQLALEASSLYLLVKLPLRPLLEESWH